MSIVTQCVTIAVFSHFFPTVQGVILECVSKMPEVHLAGNSVAVTASLPAFLR
jgi:hypothetical protein